MSNQVIVPSVDGSDRYMHDLGGPESIVTVDLIGGNHKMKHFVSPEKGHKNLTLYNPTPASVKPVLNKIKEPSTLLLRGCESLLLSPFLWEKFTALTSLEISSISYLTIVPYAISQMTQLQSLNLSHLPITHLPEFLSKLTDLRALVLRGCYNLHSIPEFPQMLALELLDLSGLLIETLPLPEKRFSNLHKLRWLILRGCSKLRYIPYFFVLGALELLDLSHCTALEQIGSFNSYHKSLQMIDLSHTAFRGIIMYCNPYLTHLFIRDIGEFEFYSNGSLPSLKVVDLSGVRHLGDLQVFKESRDLVALDLSRTGIEYVDFITHMVNLRHLILGECTALVNLPEMKRLTNLEVLDISGCEIINDLPEDLNELINLKELNLSRCSGIREMRECVFDDMSCLEKLDLSATSLNHLPSIANLTNLLTLNLSHTSVEKVPDLPNLVNLKELLLFNCKNIKVVAPDSEALSNQKLGDIQERVTDQVDDKIDLPVKIRNVDEFHLVSTFISKSGFDRFRYEFTKLDALISDIQNYISPDKSRAPITTNKMMSETFLRNFRSLRADLNYILENIDLLETSPKDKNIEELLDELVNAASRLSANDFFNNFTKLNVLLRIVAMLKLLVPRSLKQMDVEEDKKKKKKKKKKKLQLINNEEVKEEDASDTTPEEMDDLFTSYESLTDVQKNCLMYFAGFPLYGCLDIEERILIHLWYCEGFIDPLETSTNTRIKEIGRQILEVLKEKEFIGRTDIRRWGMDPKEHSFVKARAEEARLFDLDAQGGNLLPHFTASRRACLLRPQHNFPSSSQLWLSYTTSSEKLESFKTVTTLLYVDEKVVDIKAEWFSCMKNLRILHLGSLHHTQEQVDIVDLKFLEELKNMNMLRLLSLESFSAILKLPDSVCKLTNLKILNLRFCSNLEELPVGIGSLNNLTYLDLTQCHLLSKMPKGVSLLSKLEVLKGFIITYEHSKACTLRDLVKLESLRKLNLVVNKKTFPGGKDLHTFKEMKSLSNLKITWKRSHYEDQEPQNESVGQSRWKQLKCWKHQQALQNDSDKEELRVFCSSNLKKLSLCCLPSETTPQWLDPSELQNLEKLYIVGGDLKTLGAGTHPSTWNVKTLRLKYLSNLDMDWLILMALFPHMTNCEIFKCRDVRNYDGDSSKGVVVWTGHDQASMVWTILK